LFAEQFHVVTTASGVLTNDPSISTSVGNVINSFVLCAQGRDNPDIVNGCQQSGALGVETDDTFALQCCPLSQACQQ
jgi:hypothetical protein